MADGDGSACPCRGGVDVTSRPQPLGDDLPEVGAGPRDDLRDRAGRAGRRTVGVRAPIALAHSPAASAQPRAADVDDPARRVPPAAEPRPSAPGTAPQTTALAAPPPPAPVPPTSAPRTVVVAQPRRAWGPTRVITVVVAWVLVTLACAALVAYLLGPLVQNREQRALLEDFRVALDEAAGESLFSDLDEEVGPPEAGSPVAILEIERLRLQQIVVEGVAPSQTQSGPGHVPGTGGLGQPGNAGVVARRLAFGGPFRQLASMAPGDAIVVTTEQGQSLYTVSAVERGADPQEAFAPSEGDQLTLATSGESLPWASDRGVVVRADLEGRPFVPSPQGTRSAAQDGRHGETAAWGWLIVYAVLFAIAAAAATVLYRRWMSLSTYLITTPALVALAVLAAESGTRLLPAWF